MGIPYYFSHLIKRHRGIVRDASEVGPVDNLYLDSNSIIYDELRSVEGRAGHGPEAFEAALIERVIAKIKFYIAEITPRSTVFIAFDGVAPVAKLAQQRNRRFKSALDRTLASMFRDNHVLAATQTEAWDSAAITPGTAFMHRLSIALHDAFDQRSTKTKSRMRSKVKGGKRGIEYHVSAPDEAGEGEHKIFEFIRARPDHHRSTTTFVYGIDSDLIMLALNHSHASNYRIYLYRETPEFIKSLDASLEPHRTYVIDIPLLSSHIVETMHGKRVLHEGKSLDRNVDAESEKHALYDYILLCFILGNDFVAKSPAINIRNGGLDHVMNAYRQACSTASPRSRFTLTDETGTTIRWGNVRCIFEHLAAYEHSNLLQEHTRRALQEKRTKKAHTASQMAAFQDENDRVDMYTNYVSSIPVVRRDSEKRVDPFNTKWEARYYRELFGFDLDENALPMSEIGGDSHVRGACVNYLESLEWTMRYYTRGCVDWAWRYRHQYAPLMADLSRHTPGFATRLLEEKAKDPIEPLSLLVYVSPKASLGRLLPPALVERILSDHPEWYSDEWSFRWAYCKYFWESHAVMHEIDLDALRVVVQRYSQSP